MIRSLLVLAALTFLHAPPALSRSACEVQLDRDGWTDYLRMIARHGEAVPIHSMYDRVGNFETKDPRKVGGRVHRTFGFWSFREPEVGEVLIKPITGRGRDTMSFFVLTSVQQGSNDDRFWRGEMVDISDDLNLAVNFAPGPSKRMAEILFARAWVIGQKTGSTYEPGLGGVVESIRRDYGDFETEPAPKGAR